MNTRARLAFAAICILWGIPYLLIKIAVAGGVPPAIIALVRVVLGAAILLSLSRKRGLIASMKGKLKWMIAFAFAEVVVPFPLIAAGERWVDSSVAAILVASAPLFVALLALKFDHTERVRGWRLAGLFIGLAGVIFFVGIDFGGKRTELLGALAILVSAFFYAVGPMILKRHLSDLDPAASMGVSLIFAALMLTPIAVLQPMHAIPSHAAIWALLGLGVLCTALAFVAYSVLVSEAGAGRALVITYINPVIAVGLGMITRGERLGQGAFVGLVLILFGTWISTRSANTQNPERLPTSDFHG